MKLTSPSITYNDGELLFLDQTLLPKQEVWKAARCIDDMCEAIVKLRVRGAPLIGIAAMLSLAQFAQQGASIADIKKAINRLASTRPTAVNLSNYLTYLESKLSDKPLIVLDIAEQLFLEDVTLCENMAVHGASLLKPGDVAMTICNAGALATVGIGTAVGVLTKAHEQNRLNHVYACETRPLLQGARLTAWELEKAKVPYTLICDNMAASVMKQGKINAIFTGADRIAANGDTANKIGTYNLAVLAQYHRIPFYIVAPYTTLDAQCVSGDDIVIEERKPEEVKGFLGQFEWAPETAQVYNPAFDVTPAKLITGYVLDKGVVTADELKAIL